MEDIILNKCAFRTDAENEAEIRPCRCQRIYMRIYHQGRWYLVSVCRNYHAELFNRYRNMTDGDFNASTLTRLEIARDVFGSVLDEEFDKSIDTRSFLKLGRRGVMEDFFIRPDPGVKRIPVRIDERTVILVAEGDDIAAHVERFRNHRYDCPGTAPWW